MSWINQAIEVINPRETQDEHVDSVTLIVDSLQTDELLELMTVVKSQNLSIIIHGHEGQT